MKKFLPIILLLAGIIVLVVVFVVVRGGKDKEANNLPKEELALLDLSLNERPVVSLTPTSDGHFLNLKVEKIGFSPFSLDYELLYQVPGGVQQGVPGTVNLDGKIEFNAELLLGSESSGNFRYDEGVEEGTVTLRFRNEEGKLLVRFTTDFRLQTNTDQLVSSDDIFKYNLDEESDEYFVIMNTVGIPQGHSGLVENGPYGIFTSSRPEISGKVDAGFSEIYVYYKGKWQKLNENKSSGAGIFIGGSSE